MAQIPPGWYDDGHGALRFWDGSQWTEEVAPHESGMPNPWERRPRGPAPEQTAPADESGEPDTDTDSSDEPELTGIFAAATEPRSSRTWAVWVGAGVALLGFVILASVLIPVLILGFGRVAA